MKRKCILSNFVIILIFILNLKNINAQPFITGDTLSSNITYINIHDTILPIIGTFDIDIDFDNINDIRFNKEHAQSPGFFSNTYSILTLNTVQFICLPNNTDADTLIVGSIIDNTLNWNNNYNGVCFYYQFTSLIPPPWGPPSSSHGICTHPNLYIGFRKINTLDTLYGWFYLDLLNPYKIKSYAINKKFNNNISNQTINTNNINIFPNPTSNFIEIVNNFNDNNKFQLSIINSNGQVVLKTNIDLIRKFSLDIHNYKNGVYIIVLMNENEQYTSKLVVNRQ